MEKIILPLEDGKNIELFVLEQTTVGGIDYFLCTEDEEGDSDALILKDLSKRDDEDAIFEVVDDDTELDSVVKIFESILDDIDFVKEDVDEEN